MRLVFATNNRHKLQEVSAMLGDRFELLSLSDTGCNVDIPETSDTLSGNALQKARYVKEHFGMDCFADDTGLEVKSLSGAPGVHSARYAGDHDSEANITKLLGELKDKKDRTARFRTVIALLNGEREYLFEGIVNGRIADKREESDGFGYDPVFVPDGYDCSFAELGNDVKNTISHRARAIAKLVEFLNSDCQDDKP